MNNFFASNQQELLKVYMDETSLVFSLSFRFNTGPYWLYILTFSKTDGVNVKMLNQPNVEDVEFSKVVWKGL
jgi:hypothetical protein